MTADQFLIKSRDILNVPKPDWFHFFEDAYQELDESQYNKLVTTLQNIFIPNGMWDDIELIRETVLNYILIRAVEQWLMDTEDEWITFLQFRKSYLNNYLGYGPFVLREYLKANISEFDVSWEDTDPTGMHSHIIKRIKKI
jgi:hypothetical protein